MAFDPEDIIRFWVDEIGEDDWYKGGDDIDALVRDRFLPVWQSVFDAAAVQVDADPRAELAAAILLDQFPRNMFRGQAQAFASDPLARTIARRAVAANRDLDIAGPERQFFYLPFEHSEAMADQDWAVALIEGRSGNAELALHARAHREIISRFGRFPFRNAALGRDTTPGEQDFLDSGGYGAIVREMKDR